MRVLWLPLGLACVACGGGRGDSGPARDSGVTDTATVTDGDGDGLTAGEGDCDDGDPNIHPGAEETSGDGVDQDCDGSDFPGVSILSVALRFDGSSEAMTFGEVVLVVAAGEDPGALLLSGTAEYYGEYGGIGEVHVYDADDVERGAASTVLHHLDGVSFGRAVGATELVDGGRAWLVGFNDIDDFGGYCAWAAAETGTLDTTGAACIPPFENGIDDRAGISFSAATDLDGDGLADLAAAGSTRGAAGLSGAIWLTRGPLDLSRLAEPPELAVGEGFETVPRFHAAGDLDQDGYLDLPVSDESADIGGMAAGAAYVIPGGVAFPASFDALDGVDGDQPEAQTGKVISLADLDGDGVLDVCVSAPLDDTVGDRAGRVGCFYGPFHGRHTLSEAPVLWLAEEANSFFGYSMGHLDLDGDGDDEIAVGTPDDAYLGRNRPGKVYLFEPEASAPIGLLVGESEDELGLALGTGDVDGDGWDDLAVGAPWTNAARGAAYLIRGGTGAW